MSEKFKDSLFVFLLVSIFVVLAVWVFLYFQLKNQVVQVENNEPGPGYLESVGVVSDIDLGNKAISLEAFDGTKKFFNITPATDIIEVLVGKDAATGELKSVRVPRDISDLSLNQKIAVLYNSADSNNLNDVFRLEFLTNVASADDFTKDKFFSESTLFSKGTWLGYDAATNKIKINNQTRFNDEIKNHEEEIAFKGDILVYRGSVSDINLAYKLIPTTLDSLEVGDMIYAPLRMSSSTNLYEPSFILVDKIN